MAKQIINNLVLGNMHDIPNDADLVLSCAQELFESKFRNSNSLKELKDNKIFYNFKDYPKINELDISLVDDAIKQIEQNIESKKIYVHCIWGVNRSASIVFMFMVRNNYISNKDYKTSQEEFWKIYPNHSPNPGWQEFLIKNFPYNFKK